MDHGLAALARAWERVPHHAMLGVIVDEVSAGQARRRMPHRVLTSNGNGMLHEGAVASLVDSAGGVASWAVDGFDPRGRASTVGRHLHVHGAERRDPLLPIADTVGRHRGLHVNTLATYGRTSSAVVASGTLTFQSVPPPSPT